ncbi:hypothetical protein EDB85DRAFT_1893191 [Lactarius pseudohatsudake]|nr:hypothetical protein EDB85DRAFT_1893191 [Lactarius pseudohatsudake]
MSKTSLAYLVLEQLSHALACGPPTPIRASMYGVVDEPPQRLLSVHTHMLHNLHLCDPHEAPNPSLLLQHTPPPSALRLPVYNTLLEPPPRTKATCYRFPVPKSRSREMAHHYGLAHVRSLDPARRLCSTRQPRPVPNPSRPSSTLAHFANSTRSSLHERTHSLCSTIYSKWCWTT